MNEPMDIDIVNDVKINAAEVFDPDKLTKTIQDNLQAVSEAIAEYKKAMRETEEYFEVLVTSNQIERYQVLLTNITENINKIKKGYKILDGWFSFFSQTSYEIIVNLSKFKNLRNNANNISGSSLTSIPGFKLDAYTKAKAKINIFKTYARTKQGIESLGHKIETSYNLLGANVRLFNSGIIQYEKETINLVDLFKGLENLVNSNSSSPLINARNYISKFIDLPEKMDIKYEEPKEIINVKHLDGLADNPKLTNENITTILKNISETLIYTSTIGKTLDSFLEKIKTRFNTVDNIEGLIETIKSNNIQKVVEKYKNVNPNSLHYDMHIINKYIENLAPEDYFEKQQLKEIKEKQQKAAKAILDTE